MNIRKTKVTHVESVGEARRRRTFTSVSFKTIGSRVDGAYALSYAYYKEGRLENEGVIKFRPLVGGTGRFAKLDLFEAAFEKIRSVVTSSDIPVLIWDGHSMEIFDNLILNSGNGILMQKPPRYFVVRNYAVQKIGKVAKDWSWREISNKFKIKTAATKEPDAEQLAALMLQIENQVDFPAIVAKAFCKFCDSILEDKVVTLNEATELRSFVELISDKYPEFNKLEGVLEDILADGKVTEAESQRLVRILTGMCKYYRKFIDVKISSAKK